MRLMPLAIGSLISCIFCLGCGKGAPHSSVPAALPIKVAQAPENAAPVAGEVAAPKVARKIIFNCQIDLIVDNILEAQEKLARLIESVNEQGGFLARQDLSGANNSQRRGSWTIRVPLATFDSFVSQVEKMGDLERSSRDAQDVTEAYADLESRMRNKESSEKRLISHLEQSAQLKDTLELEKELTRVRGEIEQMQGQLNVLKSKTDLATVTVSISERLSPKLPVQATFFDSLSRSFEGSCKNLMIFCQTLTIVVAALLPWAFVAALFAFPVWLILKRQRTSVRENTLH